MMYQKEQKSIAIIFANLKGNIGDFAILESMLVTLSEFYPDHGIDVYSHPLTPTNPPYLMEFRKKNTVPFRLVGQTFFDHKRAFWNRKNRQSMNRVNLTQEITIFEKRYSKLFANFADYRGVFVAGGEQFVGPRLSFCMFSTIKCISKYNPNIFIYPFSVRPDIIKLFNLEKLSEHFDCISGGLVVRDSITKSVLDRLNVDAKVGLDCVYCLGDVVKTIPPAIRRDHSRILLAVSPSKNPNELRDAIETIINSGRSVEMLTTCVTEDREQLELLSEEYGISWLAPISWRNTVSEFKSSCFIITNRLHGLILGSLARTPLLPVMDRKKPEAFVADAEMPFFLKSIGDLTTEIIANVENEHLKILEKQSLYALKKTILPTLPI